MFSSSVSALVFFFPFFFGSEKHGLGKQQRFSKLLILSKPLTNSLIESILLLLMFKVVRCRSLKTPQVLKASALKELLDRFNDFKFLNSDTSIFSRLLPEISKLRSCVGSFPSSARLRMTRNVNKALSLLKPVLGHDSKISGTFISVVSRYVKGHSGL